MKLPILPCLGVLATVLSAGPSLADQTDQDARQFLQQAIQAEMAGDAEARRSLLEQAVASDPNYAPAHWQLGHLYLNDQWMPIADVEQFYRQDERLIAYRAKRDAAANLPSSELALARWCRRNEMPEWAVAHLTRVLGDPRSSAEEKAGAAKYLNLELYRGIPVAADDLPLLKKREQEVQQAIAAWNQKVATWTQQLSGRGEHQRAEALARFYAIRDVKAIPALESQLSASSEAGATIVLSILANIPDVAATRSLVRHALAVPWRRVVQDACSQLKARPIHEYMPDLLGRLETPVHFASEVSGTTTGHIRRQHVMYREGVHQNQAHFVDMMLVPTIVRRQRIGAPSVTAEFDRQKYQYYLIEAQLQAHGLEQQLADRNLQIAARNARVFQVLESVTDVILPQTPVDWWNWWQDYNEVQYANATRSKPTAISRSYAADSYLYGVVTYTQPPMSCFVAGTTVWTEIGQVPIEDLRIGDRVLTQDPETGELSYQGIVDRTLRPPADILEVTLDGDLMVASTTGHPFWVSGTGWKMAKELKDGDLLHTVNGPCKVVSRVKRRERQEAYNLVVAGNGSYFVSPLGILVHDNTYRTPTIAKVPGDPMASR